MLAKIETRQMGNGMHEATVIIAMTGQAVLLTAYRLSAGEARHEAECMAL